MTAPVRIGINTLFLNPDRQGGAETYTRQLIRHLLRRSTADLHPFHFYLFSPKESEFEEEVTAHPCCSIVPASVDPRRKFRRIWWEQTRLPRLLRRHSLDLMHFPYGTMSTRYRRPSLVTVHDTLRFCFPEQMPRGQRLYRAWNERVLRRESVNVLSVSQSDAELIGRHLSVPPERTTVIYHGVNEEYSGSSTSSGDRVTEPLKQPRLLWIGRPYPRKNVDLLIEVVARLKDNSELEPSLTLIGIEEKDRQRLQAVLDQHGCQEQVTMLPPVAHEQIAVHLRGADFFLYPSLYESFGIPVLEAMSVGLPTIGADIAPFRELYGEGVVRCPAKDASTWAQEVRDLCADVDRRGGLIERGIKRSREFSWDRCVDEHLELYRRLTK